MARIIVVNAAGTLVYTDNIEARQVEREARMLARVTEPFARRMLTEQIASATLRRRREAARELAA